MFKRIFLAPLLVAGVPVVVVLGKTWLMPPRQIVVTPVAEAAIDAEAAAKRWSGAITLKKESIGQHALLHTWIGTDAQEDDTMAARLSGVAQEMKSQGTNATLPTTAALTVMQAGNKDSVLPRHAAAAVSFRALPGEMLSSDAIQVKGYAGNAERLPISTTGDADHRNTRQKLRAVFPDAVVTPGLMTAATDSRHLSGVSGATYRFSPLQLGPEDQGRFHGTNERISVANHAEMIQFYRQLILNSGGPSGAHRAA